MIHVSFIVNSTRKQSSYFEEVLSLAQKSPKLEVTICNTKHAKHAEEIAFQQSSCSDVIIAVGGDGTCHEVVQGIVNSGNKELIFGIIPNGTGNDFFKMLTLESPNEILSRLETKAYSKIDIGQINFKSSQSVFLNIADVGFGVKVVELMNKQRLKGITGKLSYASAIVRAFFTFKKIPLSVSGDNFDHKGKVLMAVFCNGSTFGHGIVINPKANITSNKLEVTIIGNVSLLTYLKYLGALKRGELINHPEIHYYQTSTIQINELNPEELIEADGEILGKSIQAIGIGQSQINLLNSIL